MVPLLCITIVTIGVYDGLGRYHTLRDLPFRHYICQAAFARAGRYHFAHFAIKWKAEAAERPRLYAHAT